MMNIQTRRGGWFWVAVAAGVALVSIPAPAVESDGRTDYAVNGGFERVYPMDAAGLERFAKAGIDSGGLLPQAWTLEPRAGTVRFDAGDDAFEGQRALRVVEGSAVVYSGFYPVLRPAPITLRLAVRGPGPVTVGRHEHFRTGQQMDPAFWSIPADEERQDWQVYETTFTPQAAARSFRLLVRVPAGCAVDGLRVLAPAGVLAELPRLDTRPERDADTLLLLNFDEELPATAMRIDPVEFVEGPFGRALRFDPQGVLKLPIGNHVHPEEGTLEFWMRFAEGNARQRRRVINIGSNTGFRVGTDPYERILFGASQNWKGIGSVLAGLQHWGPGAWRHVAVTWSGDTWQLFMDGILVSLADRIAPETEPHVNAPFWRARPTGFAGDITIGSADLALADIRISSRARYGRPPEVRPDPVTVTADPLPVAAVAPNTAPNAPDVAPDVWQPTFRRGDLSFDATDREVVERDGARFREIAIGDLQGIALQDRETMLAWTLTGLEADAYHIGVVVGPGAQYRQVYLNGRAIQFDAGGEAYLDERRGNPRLREWVTGEAVALREGDSIRVNGIADVMRLNLYRSPPPRGMVNVEQASPIPDFYRFDAAIEATSDNALEGRYAIRNVHGRADTVTLKAQIVDYEQRVLWTSEETFALQPFEQRAFTAQTPGSATWLYRLKLQATGSDGREQWWTVSCMPDVTEGLRPRQWLSGNAWEVAAQANNQRRLEYADARNPAVKNVVVPGPWPREFATTFEHVAWYRHAFNLEPRDGQRYVLHFDQVLVSGEIYVNGHKAGQHFGPYTPFEVEITPFVKAGTNVLEVGITDPVATLPEATLDRMPTGEAVSFWSLSNWLDAPRMGNTPQMGDVYLETRPMVHARDVRVICDYPERRVEVRFDINARGPARRVRVGHQVFHAGQPVLTIPEREVDLVADGAVELEMAAHWEDPVLWQMEDPRLCVLVTTVREGETVLDEARTRFGFAHWRTEGHRLLLNDTPKKLRFAFQINRGYDLGYTRGHASPSVTAELDYAKRYGQVNGLRATPNVRKLTYADELGFVARTQVTGLWNPTASNILHDRYWENAARFGAGAARALGNHPSIAFWEASNEYACFAYYQDLPDGFERACERLWEVHQAILRERPDRIVESDADGDLNSRAQSINLHYPLDRHVGALIGGLTYYYPDSAFWRPLDRPPQPGDLLPADYSFRLDIDGRRGKIKWGEKMVGTGETSWSAQHNGPFGFTTLVGNKAYEDDVGALQGWAAASRFYLGAQRDVELAYTFYWNHYFSWNHRKVVPPIGVVPLEHNTRFFSGTAVRRRFNLHNDTGTARDLRTELTWIAEGVERILAAREDPVGPAGIARLDFEFEVPRVNGLTRGRLAWRVREGDRLHWDDSVPAAIWPAHPKIASGPGVYRFDPQGALEPLAMALGMELPPAATGLPPEGATGLLVAPGALTNLAAVVTRAALLDRLAAGLKLVVLAQSQLPRDWLPVTPEIDAVRRSGIAFARDPAHPALAELTSDDLRFWAGDHQVSSMDYVRPTRGNWRVIVDSGSGGGLDQAPLLEGYAGAGRIVLCQMPLVEKAVAEPAAAQMLANLVAYAGARAPHAPGPAALVARADSLLVQAAERLNVRAEAFDPATQPPDILPDVALVDLSKPLPSEWVEALTRHAASGGTVQLGEVRPETKAQAEAIGGRALAVYPLRDPFQHYGPYYRGRAVVRRADAPLLAGISNHEMCWIGRPSAGHRFFTTAGLIREDLIDFECRPAEEEDEADSLVYPHALLDFRTGQGRVIINQMRWMAEVGEVQDRADRLAVALLTNLGVQLDPPEPRRVMPAGVRREPLDLRPFMNLALTDETAGDGKGGWSDQGSRFDMRNLPTGRLVSEGVPFEILEGERACLVLANNRRPMQPENPESATIPVGRNIAGAWFLHSMAWGAGRGLENFHFVMEYEDGRTDALPIVTGRNAWDWSMPLPHTFQTDGPRAWTAFTTHSEGFPEVSVFAVEWVNPHPETPVRSIRFESLNEKVVPILLAITLALPPPAGTAPPPPPRVAAMTEAEQKQVQALRAAGQIDALIHEIEGILDQAAAKVDARKLLAFTLWKERRDFDGAETHYLEALKLTGENVDTLNRLGELNEERQAYAKARDYYQRSLKMEWNQPPTMDALQRVEAALGR